MDILWRWGNGPRPHYAPSNNNSDKFVRIVGALPGPHVTALSTPNINYSRESGTLKHTFRKSVLSCGPRACFFFSSWYLPVKNADRAAGAPISSLATIHVETYAYLHIHTRTYSYTYTRTYTYTNIQIHAYRYTYT